MAEKIIRDLRMTHSSVRESFETLAQYLRTAFIEGSTPHLFLPFETYRSPLRQQNLYDTTNSTKSQAWESPHQYGMAVDFVPATGDTGLSAAANGRDKIAADRTKKPEWSWSIPAHDWVFLDQMAKKAGLLRPISWDRPHIESRLWQQLRSSLRSLR